MVHWIDVLLFNNYFQDALPMINKLRFEEAFRPAMQLVFGKTLVCRNLEVASQFSKSENMDCITLEGTYCNISYYNLFLL